jgi:Zn-dependent peptidase ImmA (M78 family)
LHEKQIIENPDAYQVLYRTNVLMDEQNPLEKEANCFAANLLVPMSMLERFKDYSASIVATIFNVSQQVINFRLKDLERVSSYT